MKMVPKLFFQVKRQIMTILGWAGKPFYNLHLQKTKAFWSLKRPFKGHLHELQFLIAGKGLPSNGSKCLVSENLQAMCNWLHFFLSITEISTERVQLSCKLMAIFMQ